ncbi:MAG: Hsp20/alpha crystallin family protein [Candidatus Dormibacteria bacterium]
MTLVRWNPAFDVLNIHSEVDRVFNEMMQGAGFTTRASSGPADHTFLPIDVSRKEGEILIEASVAGFSPEEVSVTVDGGVLTIDARHETQTPTQPDGYLRRERHFGALYREIALGEGVDGDAARASFANGVLTVTIPTLKKPEPRRIPVATTVQGRVEAPKS